MKALSTLDNIWTRNKTERETASFQKETNEIPYQAFPSQMSTILNQKFINNGLRLPNTATGSRRIFFV